MPHRNQKVGMLIALLAIASTAASSPLFAAGLRLPEILKVCDRLKDNPETPSDPAGANYLNCCPVASTFALTGHEAELQAACGQLMKPQ